MIELRNVTKSFDVADTKSAKSSRNTVLSRVSLKLAPGEVLGLLGPSGCGKSTLLRCINGLEEFDDGEIQVGPVMVKPGDATAKRRSIFAARASVGFVFQQWNLFAHRTALGNVIEAPIHVRGMPKADAVAKAHALLEKVGLAHRAGAYPHEMSGGEQQRVAIARALAMEPLALLLDEPTSALDPTRTADVKNVLRKLAEEGTAMVLVTHETRFAREVSRRVVVLHGGEIVEEGTPDDVLDRPQDARTRAYLGPLA